MARGIDHLVVATTNIEAARDCWNRLGFTTTPIARHPFGTLNALIQLAGSYIELLAVADIARIPADKPGHFSFAAFNRDFLARHEGISMLALKSADATADRSEFESKGLLVFEPFSFERMATGPDGIDRVVSFSLAFTREARLKKAGFFTCRHHRPENFWHRPFQSHANGATALLSVALVARDPADFHEFMTHFTGRRDMISTSLGVTFETGDGAIEILSPVGYEARFGETCEADPRRFLGCRIAVADIDRTRKVLAANSVPLRERMDRLLVPPTETGGVALAFELAGKVKP